MNVLLRYAPLLALCLASSLAEAGVQVVTAPIQFSVSNDNSGKATTRTQTLLFNRIDPAKDRITGGTLSISLTTSYDGTAFSFRPATLSGAATGTTTQSLAAPASGAASSGSTSLFALFDDVGAFDTKPFTNLNGVQKAPGSVLSLTAADLAQFAGTGQIGLTLTTTQTSVVTVFGGVYNNASIGTATNVGGSVRATLTFSTAPVPEPAPFAALGLGVVALVKRRKRA